MSSGSESDEEYVPEEPEQLSEEESADEETEKQYSEELEHKTKKRKAEQDSKAKKKRRNTKMTKDVEEESVKEENGEQQQNLDPVEEKKREDDLWAKFLEGTDTKPKAPSKELNDTIKKPDEQKISLERQEQKEKKKSEDEKEKERRIFEFAGETIVVENNVIKEKIKTAEAPGSASKLEGPSSRRGGGLSDVLGQINKKNKLSTLEKSKLDWETYKKEEGIEDEIQHHNKGKGGYLERKDFLERADMRQYEIERDLRMSRRSNR